MSVVQRFPHASALAAARRSHEIDAPVPVAGGGGDVAMVTICVNTYRRPGCASKLTSTSAESPTATRLAAKPARLAGQAIRAVWLNRVSRPAGVEVSSRRAPF